MTMRKLLLLLLAAANLTCAGALMTAPPGSTVTLTANPDAIAANGGVSVITAFVMEPAGTTVPDGTVIQFFTTLGRIDPELGKTKDGVARVNLISDSRSGTAAITGVSGGGTPTPAASASPGPPPVAAASTSGSTSVIIGGAQSLTMIVIADPSRITDSRSTHIIANVFDRNGNPFANIGAIFEVVSSTTTEFMDSQGNPLYTDNNGRVEDILRTRRTSPGTATVKVTLIGGGFASGTVSVPILLQ
jgi:hypothetical protein